MDERATTSTPGTLLSATAISSVNPSAKKSWSASPDALAKGSTAMVGRVVPVCAAARGKGAQTESPMASANAKTCGRFNTVQDDDAIAPCPHDFRAKS